jgi:hypothetical protein
MSPQSYDQRTRRSLTPPIAASPGPVARGRLQPATSLRARCSATFLLTPARHAPAREVGAGHGSLRAGCARCWIIGSSRRRGPARLGLLSAFADRVFSGAGEEGRPESRLSSPSSEAAGFERTRPRRRRRRARAAPAVRAGACERVARLREPPAADVSDGHFGASVISRLDKRRSVTQVPAAGGPGCTGLILAVARLGKGARPLQTAAPGLSQADSGPNYVSRGLDGGRSLTLLAGHSPATIHRI